LFTIVRSKENKIRLTLPKVITFWIAVVLGVLGYLVTLVTDPAGFNLRLLVPFCRMYPAGSWTAD